MWAKNAISWNTEKTDEFMVSLDQLESVKIWLAFPIWTIKEKETIDMIIGSVAYAKFKL